MQKPVLIQVLIQPESVQLVHEHKQLQLPALQAPEPAGLPAAEQVFEQVPVPAVRQAVRPVFEQSVEPADRPAEQAEIPVFIQEKNYHVSSQLILILVVVLQNHTLVQKQSPNYQLIISSLTLSKQIIILEAGHITESKYLIEKEINYQPQKSLII